MTRPLASFLVLAATATLAFAAYPRLVSVEPAAAQPGDEVTANGHSLEAANVTKLFLTAGGKDIEVEMAEQTAETIRFTIPADTPLGSYNLMVQTGGPQPALMEQPVRLEVADEATLSAKAAEAKRRQEELAQPVEPAPAPEAPPNP